MAQRSCNRKKVPNAVIDNVMRILRDRINTELDKKGSGGFASRHEVNGVLEEEFDELKKVSHDHKGGLLHYEDELYDVAVASVFGIASIHADCLEW